MTCVAYINMIIPILLLHIFILSRGSYAQTAPNCPLSGPVYLVPGGPITQTTAIPKAISTLNGSLNLGLQNGTLNVSNSSFHITIFSASETLFEFNHVAPATRDGLTSGTLDRNTIFRTGSIGKLLTTYSLLAATGLRYINDPVTKWVPELAAVSFENDVDTVRWEDISIKALVSHLSGLRDFSIADLSLVYNVSEAEQLGLPTLQKDRVLTCGTDIKLPACSRSDFFNQFEKLHPVTSAFNMPIYSNVAWQVLAYAIEGMTNKTFAEHLEASLTRPLNLTGTFLSPPPRTTTLNAIIPGNEIESWWALDAGDGTSSAAGLTVSTGADLAAVGQSILSSSLLPQPLTREWLKPVTHTSDLRLSVGMPWEIFRTELASPSASIPNDIAPKENTRIVDVYCKNGGIGAYNTEISLSPEQGFGFVVLTAGRPPTSGPDLRPATLQLLNRMITETFLPAFELAAQEQTAHRFAGTYASSETDGSSKMSLTLVVSDGGLGLGVYNWTEGGQDRLKSYFAAIEEGNVEELTQKPTLRLYPVGLFGGQKLAFRGVFEVAGQGNVFSNGGTPPFRTYCASWSTVGAPTYGNVGLDDFVFEVDQNGRTIALIARGARRTMYKQF